MHWDIVNDREYALLWRKSQVAGYLDDILANKKNGQTNDAEKMQLRLIDAVSRYVVTNLSRECVQEIVLSAVQDTLASELAKSVPADVLGLGSQGMEVLADRVLRFTVIAIENREAIPGNS
jgi:hypothetical protein